MSDLSSPTPPPTTALAAAIEWLQAVRSAAAAAAGVCMQQSSCALASSHGTCQSDPTPCTSEQMDTYRRLVQGMHTRMTAHSSILNPLLLSLTQLNALPNPASVPLMSLTHALALASQSLSSTIAQQHSLIAALMSRSVPSLPQDDPLLRAVREGGAMVELVMAQDAASDAAAAAAAAAAVAANRM